MRKGGSFVESPMKELNPSRGKVDQECIGELCTGILVGEYGFTSQDIGKVMGGLCSYVRKQTHERVIAQEAKAASSMFQLGNLKERFEQVSSAYDYFNHGKFRMDPEKPKSAWTVAGMTNPRKRAWKVLRRNWNKTSASEKLAASAHISMRMASKKS